MKKSSHNIVSLLRLLAFIVGICAMVIRPAIQSLNYLDKQDFELVDINSNEKDSNEKNSDESENQENDNKDEKVELQLSSLHYNTNTFIKKSSIFGVHFVKWDFTLETHIPPPQTSIILNSLSLF